MIYVIGFLAQICFSGRLLFQWIMSEKAKQVVSPSIFWLLSLLGSYLLFSTGGCGTISPSSSGNSFPITFISGT